MRHQRKIRKMSRNLAQRKALVRSLAISFFLHKSIETTESKAKILKPVVERCITRAKQGDLAGIRLIIATLGTDKVVTLIKETAEHCKDRPGGYTRIIHLMPRLGDNASMVILKLV